MTSRTVLSQGAPAALRARAERFSDGLVQGVGRTGWSAALAGVVVAALCTPAVAGPEDARVVRGDVRITRNGSETTIHAGRNSIINYRSFDIARGETVRFVQPDAQSRVLNRIEGRTPTRIDGSLLANGRVYLVNPAGIYFGRGSVVNVAALYAAAGKMSDQDFLRGTDRFTNLAGDVTNAGRVEGGLVAMVGARVSNIGEIVAPQGTVVMGSGEDVLIGERTGNVFVKIDGAAAAAPAGQGSTDNSGTIRAPKGRVIMGAGDSFAIAVRSTGQVKAAKVRIEGSGAGEVRVSGAVDASNATGMGGDVRVLGEKVGLASATVDASGRDGGGDVSIGGNFQGKGPDRNAERTFVSTDTIIRVDATRRGDGGDAIVWSDDITRFHGHVSAIGGSLGGDGGFVEVSGKQHLAFTGTANTTAPRGRTGMLLLDPRDILISNTGGGPDDAELADGSINFGDGGTNDFTITPGVIESASSNVTLQATRDITFDDAVSMSNDGVGIIAQAGRTITVNAPVTTRGGQITLTANDAASGGASGDGGILINAALSTAGNSIAGGPISLNVDGGTGLITLGANLTTRGGAITLGGPVVINADTAIDSTHAGGAPAGGAILIEGTVNADAAVNNRALTLIAGQSTISLQDAVGGTQPLGSVTATSSAASPDAISLHDVSTRLAQSYNGAVSLDGDLVSTVAGAITIDGALLLLQDAALTSAGASGIDDLVVTGTIESGGGTARGLTLNAGSGGDIELRSAVGGVDELSTLGATARSMVLFGVTTTGNQSYTGATFLNAPMTSGAGITLGGASQVNQDLAITAATFVTLSGALTSQSGLARDLTINAQTTTFAGAVGLGTGNELGTLTLDAGGSANVGAGSVTTVDSQTWGDNVVLQGPTTFASTTGGDITFAGTVNSDGTGRALAVNTSGVTSFGGVVGGLSPLATLTTDAPGSLRLGANITTTGAQTLNDPVTLTGNVSLTGGSIDVAGAVDSDSTARVFAIGASGGAVTLGGALGATNAISSVTINAATIGLNDVRTVGAQSYSGITTLNGDYVSTSAGPISFGGNVLIAGATLVQTAGDAGTDDISFSGTINSTGSAQPLTLNAGEGDISLAGDTGLGVAGGQFPLASITATGATISLNDVRTTGAHLYNGPTSLAGALSSTTSGDIDINGALTLTADATIGTTAGGVFFRSTVNSDGTARALTVNTGGSGLTRFGASVGGINRLSTLTTNADGSTFIAAGQIRTSGDTRFQDAVTLGGDVVIEVNDLSFDSTLNSDALNTPRTLTVNSGTNSGDAGETVFTGAVGGVNRLRRIDTNADGVTRFGANVSTTDGLTLGDALELLGDSVVDAGSGSMFFRSTINAATGVTLPRLTLLTTRDSLIDYTQPTNDRVPIRFGGSIGATRRLGMLAINEHASFTPRTTPQRGVTAVMSDSYSADGRILAAGVSTTDAFTIAVGSGGFTMGSGQKLTAFGTLSINVDGGSATLGDVNALTSVTVTAQTIRLRLREQGDVFTNSTSTSNQIARDTGLDAVTAGQFTFSTAPTTLGTGLPPASFSNNSGSGNEAIFAGFSFRQFPGGVTTAVFNDTRAGRGGELLPLDLVARGPISESVATSLAPALPRLVEEGEVSAPLLLGPGPRDPLRAMGVDTREPSWNELVEFLVGRALYRDDPRVVSPRPADIRITANRLSIPSVEAALRAYSALAETPLLGADGSPVLSADGLPQTTSRLPRIRAVLAEAWEDYALSSPAPTGAGFRDHLTAQADSASSEALEYLDLARIVLHRVDALGLSSFEADIPKAQLLGQIRPPAMSEGQLAEAVRGRVVAAR